jgi:hypothetical protein
LYLFIFFNIITLISTNLSTNSMKLGGIIRRRSINKCTNTLADFVAGFSCFQPSLPAK